MDEGSWRQTVCESRSAVDLVNGQIASVLSLVSCARKSAELALGQMTAMQKKLYGDHYSPSGCPILETVGRNQETVQVIMSHFAIDEHHALSCASRFSYEWSRACLQGCKVLNGRQITCRYPWLVDLGLHYVARKCGSLEVLDLSESDRRKQYDISPRALKVVLKRCESLQSLKLDCQVVKVDLIKTLATGGLQLRDISMQDCKHYLDDAALEPLLKSCVNLAKLDVSHMELVDGETVRLVATH